MNEIWAKNLKESYQKRVYLSEDQYLFNALFPLNLLFPLLLWLWCSDEVRNNPFFIVNFQDYSQNIFSPNMSLVLRLHLPLPSQDIGKIE